MQEHLSAQSNPQQSQPLASRWQRLGGALLDGLLLSLIEVPALIATGCLEGIVEGRELPTRSLLLSVLIHQIAFLTVNGWLLVHRGQTVGKKLLGTRIVSLDGSLQPFGRLYLMRYLAPQAISNAPVVGAVFALVDALFVFREDHRCLHDLLAGTKVIKEGTS